MYAAISAYYAGDQATAERMIARAAKISSARDPDVFYCRSIILREKDRSQAIRDLEHFLAVAKHGWHSKGKVERVTRELAMLRQGKIPPPVEAHHHAERHDPESEEPPPPRVSAATAADAATAPGAGPELRACPKCPEADRPEGRAVDLRFFVAGSLLLSAVAGAFLGYWIGRRHRA